MDRESSCGKKIRHPDRHHAEVHAGHLNEQRGDDLNAYRCRYCGHWHVGHRRPRRGGPRGPGRPPIVVWIGPPPA